MEIDYVNFNALEKGEEIYLGISLSPRGTDLSKKLKRYGFTEEYIEPQFKTYVWRIDRGLPLEYGQFGREALYYSGLDTGIVSKIKKLLMLLGKNKDLEKNEEWERASATERNEFFDGKLFEFLLKIATNKELVINGAEAFDIAERLYKLTPGGKGAWQGLITRMLIGGSAGGVVVDGGSGYPSVFGESRISFSKNKLILFVPDHHSFEMSTKGKLIGKGGQNIKFLNDLFKKLGVQFVLM